MLQTGYSTAILGAGPRGWLGSSRASGASRCAQVRAAQLRGAGRASAAIIQVLLGSVFLDRGAGLCARARPARAGERHLDGGAAGASRRLDVAFGLRMLARLAPPPSVWLDRWAAPPGAAWRLRSLRVPHARADPIGIRERDADHPHHGQLVRDRARAAERFAARGWRVFASMRRPGGGACRCGRAPPSGLAAEHAGARRHPRRFGRRRRRRDPARDGRAARRRSSTTPATTPSGPLEETSPDELRAQLETNVVGVHRVTRAVLPAMRARRAGTVVTLGSISGRVAVPIAGPYHASKWALEGMIEAWRLELMPFGVRVALVEPGPFATALHDQRAARRRRRPPTAPTPACSPPTAGSRPGCRGQDDLDAAHRRHRAGRDRDEPAAALAGRARPRCRRPAARLRARSALRVAHAAGVSAASDPRHSASEACAAPDAVACGYNRCVVSVRQAHAQGGRLRFAPGGRDRHPDSGARPSAPATRR